jgi:hypothetical protein
MTLAPTAMGLRHMEQTKAGDDMEDAYRSAFGRNVKRPATPLPPARGRAVTAPEREYARFLR